MNGVSGTTSVRIHAARGETIGKAEGISLELSTLGDGINGKIDVEGELMRALRLPAEVL